MSEFRIPFNRACVIGRELEYVKMAVQAGRISGDGPFTRRVEALLAEDFGALRAMMTTSGTHALELAAMLLDLAPGDEVIVPTFTFVSTVNAFVLRGVRPVFVDIRPDTLNIDESHLEGASSQATRAIVPVHYAGVGCEMSAIQEFARYKRLAIVEDNAHGLYGRYRGRLLGTFGAMSIASFHETKNFTCGEGGCLLLNDEQFVARAEILREKGTDRARFFRGQVDKYTWVDVGSSYVASDILAAFLLGQLEKREQILDTRRRLWLRYYDGLSDWASAREVRLPVVPSDRDQAFHMFYLLMPSLRIRQSLIDHLRERGILAVFHYVPLHLSRMGQSFGGAPGACPVAEEVSERIVRLPFYSSLTDKDQEAVIDAVRAFQG
jgi:dTDP-4-amino-4,6-dideoxygalactose transaminase